MKLTQWWRSWSQSRREAREKQAALANGVELIVDLVDPRLRGLTNYRSRLVPALKTAVQAVDVLIDALPAPMALSREAWTTDRQLRAYFTSPNSMQDFFDTNPEVRDFLTSSAALGATEVYAALSMRIDRSTRFGTEAVGEQILADQKQKTIGFSDYVVGVLAQDETAFRNALRRRVLEEVAARTMQQILGMRTQRDALSEREDTLKWKLKIYEMRKAGIGTLLHDDDVYDRHITKLQEELGSVSTGLQDLLQRAGDLEDFLDITVQAFATVDQTIKLSPTQICINDMNVETTPERGGDEMTIYEFRIGKRRPRAVQLIRFSPLYPSVDTDRALRRAARALGIHG